MKAPKFEACVLPSCFAGKHKLAVTHNGSHYVSLELLTTEELEEVREQITKYLERIQENESSSNTK